MPVPPTGRALFNLRGPTWYESIDFDMKLIHVDAPANVRPADERYFRYVPYHTRTRHSGPRHASMEHLILIAAFFFSIFFTFDSLNKLSNEVLLNLVKSIEGPQDIELELSMTVFNNGQPFGSNIAKLFLLISAHEF